jgi:RNA polymerase sigma factor (TIGR02999 family)
MVYPDTTSAFAALHGDLRQIAGSLLRGDRAITLQPTVLVHEAYLRLAARPAHGAMARADFLALAARVMRHVIVDHARRRRAAKRGSTISLEFDPAEDRSARTLMESLEIDALLTEMAALDPQAARVAECRIFGGLTAEETGEALGLKADRVRRDWTFARTWIRRSLHS